MIKNIYKFLSPKHQTLFSDYKVNFKPRYGHGLPPHKELYGLVNENRELYKELIEKAVSYREVFFDIKTQVLQTDPNLPSWNNNFLPGLDIVAIYTMIASKNPKKYIEVGSGNSTKVAAKAKEDNQLRTEIISIDPMPRAEIDHLADKVIRKPFEDVNYDEILSLESGDILFIDNSHRILPNSDSMVFYLEILPRLNPGVIVHIHDIYIPYDYPQFMCDRFYTEQYGLMMFILANPKKYQTIFPCYFVSEDKELSDLLLPIFSHPNLKDVERHGGSYWLQIGE